MDKDWPLGYGHSMLMDWGSHDGRWTLQYAVGLRNPPAAAGLGSAAFSAGVIALQKELRALAFLYQDSKLDPAKYDGTMTLGTIIALKNAVERIGHDLPGVGTATDVVKKITDAIGSIPYAGVVIELILSPWLVDVVYQLLLPIIRLFPGGGAAASGIDTAVNAAKTTLAASALGIATALATAPKKAPPPPVDPTVGLGAARGQTGLVFYDPQRHGGCCGQLGLFFPTPPPQTPPVTQWTPWSTTPPPWTKPTPQGVPTKQVLTRDFRTGAPSIFDQAIANYQQSSPHVWGLGFKQFTKHVLNTQDRALYEHQIASVSESPKTQQNIRKGLIPYLSNKQVPGANKYYSAWYNDEQKTIKVTSYSKDAYDRFVESVEDVVDYVFDKTEDLYEVLKEYGCALVNNDLVVTVVAGTSIVVSPAASAAVVTGAAAGKAACAALELGEALYAILKLLAMDFAAPPPLNTETPPPITVTAVLMAKLPSTVVKATTGPVVMAKALIKQPVPISGRLVLPLPVAKPSAYPVGTTTRFHLQKQVWYVYLPQGAVLKGLEGLGETPPPPDLVLQQKPAGVPEGPPINEPFYKNPLFWVVVAGLAAVAGGTVVVLRKHRRQPLLQGAPKPPTSKLHERVAAVLHWSEREVHSVPLAALRDLVRPVDPRLAEELSEVMQRGTHLKR